MVEMVAPSTPSLATGNVASGAVTTPQNIDTRIAELRNMPGVELTAENWPSVLQAAFQGAGSALSAGNRAMGQTMNQGGMPSLANMLPNNFFASNPIMNFANRMNAVEEEQ